MSTRNARQAPLAGFVLHRYDWSESSLIIDLFTREQGRIAVAAKGAKRPFSQLRGVLLPFQKLSVTLGRQAGDESAREVQSLRSVEWVGGLPMLRGAALFSGFYVNELLLKLIARHDPHAGLFDAYADTLVALGEPIDGQPALRAFELMLLRECGLLPDLGVETATQRRVGADEPFRVLADSGVMRVDAPADGRPDAEATVSGATLAALQAALDGRDMAALRQAASRRPGELRPILRALVHHHLGGEDALRTRRVLRDAQSLDA